MAVGNQDILIAIQINVEKHGRPRPLRGFDAAQVGDLCVGVVAAIDKRRIAINLRAIIDRADGARRGLVWLAIA